MCGALVREPVEIVTACLHPKARYHPAGLVIGRIGPHRLGGPAEEPGMGPVLDVDRPDVAVGEGDPEVVGVVAGPHLDSEPQATQVTLKSGLRSPGPRDELTEWTS